VPIAIEMALLPNGLVHMVHGTGYVCGKVCWLRLADTRHYSTGSMDSLASQEMARARGNRVLVPLTQKTFLLVPV